MAEAFKDKPDFEAQPLSEPEKLERHSGPKLRLESLEEIRKKVAEYSQSAEIGLEKEEQTAVNIEEESEDDMMAAANHHIVSRQVKNMAYRRLLKRTRKQLPAGSRLVSYVIHQPIVDELSEAAAKSFGRPYGLIGAGAFAALGSIGLYFHSFNTSSAQLTLFMALIGGGYVLGCLGEALMKLASSNRV